MRAALIIALVLFGCAEAPQQRTQTPPISPERQALLNAIAKACTEKYGDRTVETLSCISGSVARFDRGDRSFAIGLVTCSQSGTNVACN
jgi:hypothetical protein